MKSTFNFLRQTPTSIVAPKLWIIVISNSDSKVEIIPQPIGEEQSPQALELKLVEEEVELQQLVSKDSGEEFL